MLKTSLIMCLLLLAKILVVGGYPKCSPALEIIDLINTKLKSVNVLDLNGVRVGATGSILQNQLIICGGYDRDGNITTNVSIMGMPNNSFEMMMPRSCMSSVVLNKSKMWVTGGISNNGNVEKSTEIVSLDQPPVPGPDLPFTVWHHSMVLVDPTTVYLIGGLQNGARSDKTWIIDPTNDFQIKVGPSLNFSRDDHSCSKIRIEGRIFLVVAGGREKPGILDSVELLDTTSPDQGWIMGMK